MTLTVASVSIDCADPERLAEFWSAVLGVPVEARFGDFVLLAAPEGGGPRVLLQRVPDPTPGKNRVHVDLTGESRADATARLTGLGATVVGEHEIPQLQWTIFADPEGNQFCVGEPTG